MTVKKKYETNYAKLKLVREYLKSGQTFYKFAQRKKIPESTLRGWVKKLKNMKPAKKENPNMGKTGGVMQPVDEETKRKVIKDHIVNKISMKKVADKYGYSVTGVTYWKKQWRDGKLVILGLPPTDEPTGAYTNRSTPSPLTYDASAQMEIEKLNAQIVYLKELLNENSIEWELDKVTSSAKDRYIQSIIKANGIDLGLGAEPDH